MDAEAKLLQEDPTDFFVCPLNSWKLPRCETHELRCADRDEQMSNKVRVEHQPVKIGDTLMHSF